MPTRVPPILSLKSSARPLHSPGLPGRVSPSLAACGLILFLLQRCSRRQHSPMVAPLPMPLSPWMKEEGEGRWLGLQDGVVRLTSWDGSGLRRRVGRRAVLEATAQFLRGWGPYLRKPDGGTELAGETAGGPWRRWSRTTAWRRGRGGGEDADDPEGDEEPGRVRELAPQVNLPSSPHQPVYYRCFSFTSRSYWEGISSNAISGLFPDLFSLSFGNRCIFFDFFCFSVFLQVSAGALFVSWMFRLMYLLVSSC
jgi:hypothetical protein